MQNVKTDGEKTAPQLVVGVTVTQVCGASGRLLTDTLNATGWLMYAVDALAVTVTVSSARRSIERVVILLAAAIQSVVCAAIVTVLVVHVPWPFPEQLVAVKLVGPLVKTDAAVSVTISPVWAAAAVRAKGTAVPLPEEEFRMSASDAALDDVATRFKIVSAGTAEERVMRPLHDWPT